MKLRERLAQRRRRKAHERHVRERAQQDSLRGQDAQERVRDVAHGSAGAQQGMYGQS